MYLCKGWWSLQSLCVGGGGKGGVAALVVSKIVASSITSAGGMFR